MTQWIIDGVFLNIKVKYLLRNLVKRILILTINCMRFSTRGILTSSLTGAVRFLCPHLLMSSIWASIDVEDT